MRRRIISHGTGPVLNLTDCSIRHLVSHSFILATMTSLKLSEADIGDLAGKRVIITGASSGIGLGAATIFAQRGASVLNLDINPPPDGGHENIEYRECDISKWDNLVAAFKHAGDIDIAVSNAGVSEETDYFADTFGDSTGELLEPSYGVLDVNLRAVLNFTKLALSNFRRRKYPGSIVITSSATAYAPEQSLPVYSASKLAVRSTVLKYLVCHVLLCAYLSSTNTAHWSHSRAAITSPTGGHHYQLGCASGNNHQPTSGSPCSAYYGSWSSCELRRVRRPRHCVLGCREPTSDRRTIRQRRQGVGSDAVTMERTYDSHVGGSIY